MRKLTIDTTAEAATTLEAALLALEYPSISAVSRFENGPVLWRVEAYTLDASAEPTLDAEVARAGLSGSAAWHEIADTNWVRHVEKMLSPVRAGRFLVYGPHDRAAAEGHPFAIEIEAGEAFGTAHHGSTEGCLIALSHVVPEMVAAGAASPPPRPSPLRGLRVAQPFSSEMAPSPPPLGGRARVGGEGSTGSDDDPAEAHPLAVLDLGTGSGVLAIAIAKLALSAHIVATDIDARSVEIARENAGKNGVAGSITGIEAAGLDHPLLRAPGQFDLIAANILAGPLVDLAPGVVRALRSGGRIVLSGLLDRQAAEVLHAYASAGAREVNRVTRGEWVTLVLA